MNNLHEAKILIIDDEVKLNEMTRMILELDGFNNIKTALTGQEALVCIKTFNSNIILLDGMLPDIDGFNLFPKINTMTSVPIIFVSARDEDKNRLKGLGLGADDYITKPFLPEELVLRIKSVLRRTYHQLHDKVNTIQLGDCTIDMDKNIITYNNVQDKLTAKEFAIFKKLLDNRGNIVTIDNLCDAVWKDGNYGYENTLMVHIRKLREKIEDNPSKPRYLVTVRGLGYRLAKETTL
ncbi:DNA-binding response regulator [Candidatus Epulonipiscium fishelsonii]|uniref:DNA-binding response regulator n=1 Tax=Candidatus Epulonipiscium fishelsonii TaxID=77094 RepID=A0ACC8XCZ7_9FIRM|nr:DNA-binding response regulator [Epulopiscium sp. SCG-B11WGA-EpuloA1]ONI41848.1 DNA-binding response regulator [Epulopiscium sp. SCG-B05WGA-EpuloA1]